MLFMIGIERPKTDDEAWGIAVPVFDRVNMGCTSAADDEHQILSQAKLAILDMAEEAINDGHLLSTLEEGFHDYSDAYPEFDQWVAVEVPVETLKARAKRINITLPDTMNG